MNKALFLSKKKYYLSNNLENTVFFELELITSFFIFV